MSTTKHLKVNAYGHIDIIPLVVDGVVYAAGLRDNKITIAHIEGDNQVDMMVDLPEDLDLNSVKITPHKGKGTFIVSYTDVARKLFLAVLDLSGNWLSEAVPLDTINPGACLYFDEPFIVTADGKAVMHAYDYEIENGKVEFALTMLDVKADIDNRQVGILKPVFPGGSWTVFSGVNDSVEENKGILFVLYNNTLTRLPVDCISVAVAIGGIEIVKYKPGAKKYVSSFIPGDILDASITGDRKKIKNVVKKDNTDIGNYMSIARWMKADDSQLSPAILTTAGLLISSVDGHKNLGLPKFINSVTVFMDNEVIMVDPE